MSSVRVMLPLRSELRARRAMRPIMQARTTAAEAPTKSVKTMIPMAEMRIESRLPSGLKRAIRMLTSRVIL